MDKEWKNKKDVICKSKDLFLIRHSRAEKSTERKLLWDEENRLEAVDDNGFVSAYWYDAVGERTVKESGESEMMYVNGTFSGGNTATENFTAYVNPYMVYSNNGNYTKHIYIGNQRIVSKIGDPGSFDGDPINKGKAGDATVDYSAKYADLQKTVKDRYDKLGVDYLGRDNIDYEKGQIHPQSSPLYSTPTYKPEPLQYFYHSDHLGSTSLITDLDDNVAQHIEYVPFGEVFIEERNNTWNTPFLFNAKELDEETGLYYYGARYYEPRASLWLSTDPLQEKYPEVSTYAYCNNNPVNATDPTGKDLIFLIKTSSGTGRYKFMADGSFKGVTDGKTYNFSGGGHQGQIIDGYRKMLNSGDENYVKQVTTLINSKNVHEVDATVIKNNGVAAGSGTISVSEAESKAMKGEGIGTTTRYGDLSEKELECGDGKDVGKTNYTTVAHEVQHQYDYDQGNMKDDFDKNGKQLRGQNSPAEQRAMKNEDYAREKEHLKQRRIY